jgi:hypothetical protein
VPSHKTKDKVLIFAVEFRRGERLFRHKPSSLFAVAAATAAMSLLTPEQRAIFDDTIRLREAERVAALNAGEEAGSKTPHPSFTFTNNLRHACCKLHPGSWVHFIMLVFPTCYL